MSNTRQQFEEWASGEPYSLSTKRFPEDPAVYGWPGSYCCSETDFAWQAWKEATRLSKKDMSDE